MKKFFLFGVTLALLAACSDSDNTTPGTSNTAGDTNVENVSTEPSTQSTEQSNLLQMVATMESWLSYQSITSFNETYESADYPDSEFHVDKQYVAEPAQVHAFSSLIGFSGSTIEQYASYEYADGGFESMDGGEFYDMDTEAVDLVLKNGLPSRAALLRTVLNNATNVTETDGTFSIDLDEAALAELFEQMQAAFMYNAQPSELDADTLSVLTIGTETFHSGQATIVTDGTAIISYDLLFDVTSEISGRTEATFSETYNLVDVLDVVEPPEELMMGIGVN